MKSLSILLFLSLISCLSFGQYTFTTEKELACTAVKSQQKTGTCWSFATASFLESELIRKGKKEVDLSEMFVVRNIYMDKAKNYVLRQGKANFSQGSLSHDLINIVSKYGIVPESVFDGKIVADDAHNHSEMEAGLKGFLDGVRKQKNISPRWKLGVEAILDTYLGEMEDTFKIKGVSYTPLSYAKTLDINPDDYISLTSFTHHPFYSSFILEIPDNYSNGSYYNIPIEELMQIMDFAVIEGYTIAWDGDVSEKGFSAKKGIAVLPIDTKREDLFKTPGKEISVTQENRQTNFESYSTTDDHLMHIVGVALDQDGNRYYKTKNSWGEISQYKGYIYMSEAYMKMKTVAIMVHKDAIPRRISEKIFKK